MQSCKPSADGHFCFPLPVNLPEIYSWSVSGFLLSGWNNILQRCLECIFGSLPRAIYGSNDIIGTNIPTCFDIFLPFTLGKIIAQRPPGTCIGCMCNKPSYFVIKISTNIFVDVLLYNPCCISELKCIFLACIIHTSHQFKHHQLHQTSPVWPCFDFNEQFAGCLKYVIPNLPYDIK